MPLLGAGVVVFTFWSAMIAGAAAANTFLAAFKPLPPPKELIASIGLFANILPNLLAPSPTAF
jgi:hypothetical protein